MRAAHTAGLLPMPQPAIRRALEASKLAPLLEKLGRRSSTDLVGEVVAALGNQQVSTRTTGQHIVALVPVDDIGARPATQRVGVATAGAINATGSLTFETLWLVPVAIVILIIVVVILFIEIVVIGEEVILVLIV